MPSGRAVASANARPSRCASTDIAASPPTTAATRPVINANVMDRPIAASGDPIRVLPASIVVEPNSADHQAAVHPDDEWTDAHTSDATGASTMRTATIATAATAIRAAPRACTSRKVRVPPEATEAPCFAAHSRTDPTTTAWIAALTAAPWKSKRIDVCRSTSASRVRVDESPSRSTMPSEVNENTKTIAAADAMAGPRDGSVTVRNATHRFAPRVRAAVSIRGSMVDHRAPTMRITTAIFRYACARTTMTNPVPRLEPRRARNASATTTVGRTKGTVANANTQRRPSNR